MKAPKILLIGTASLFVLIGTAAVFKSKKEVNEQVQEVTYEEIQIDPTSSKPERSDSKPRSIVHEDDNLPDANIINRLFAVDSSRLPIVETVTYTSRVPWLQGRPAWIADYASHYATSRHFIARSLNRTLDYFTQKVAPGDRFNVFSPDKEIQFRLVIDLSRCRMWFYYHDLGTDELVLLKTYSVGLGRKDDSKASGYLTPTGKYTLGSKVAIYKPGTMGYFQDQKTEMIRVFGTRWIPFDQEIDGCSENPKGFGIHGSPWEISSNGSMTEDVSHIGKYDSDGCIRLNSKDIEELFAIIITKPTVVELVHDFHDADLPRSHNQGDRP